MMILTRENLSLIGALPPIEFSDGTSFLVVFTDDEGKEGRDLIRKHTARVWALNGFEMRNR